MAFLLRSSCPHGLPHPSAFLARSTLTQRLVLHWNSLRNVGGTHPHHQVWRDVHRPWGDVVRSAVDSIPRRLPLFWREGIEHTVVMEMADTHEGWLYVAKVAEHAERYDGEDADNGQESVSDIPKHHEQKGNETRLTHANVCVE